jgi:DNA repair exonuclease SbcCD ATPase subunit
VSYDNPYGESYGRQIRDLDGRVDDVDTRLDEVESDLRTLSRKVGDVDDLDYELRRIEEAADDAQRDADNLNSELNDHVADTSRRLKKLTARIKALEALARTAGDAPVADLDTIDPEWERLAKTAQRGHTAEAGLLTDTARAAHHHAIQQHRQALQRRREAQQRAIAAARILATTPPTATEHKNAARDFGLAIDSEERTKINMGHLGAEASEAGATLKADDAQHEKVTPVIEEGEKAARKLSMILRSRLADAIAARAVQPMWFVTVLGPVPPADHTQEWMDLAVDVLIYRVTHTVTDQVVALGPPPTGDALRAARHRELTKALRAWNN